MKKLFLFSNIIFLLFIASCTKEDDLGQPTESLPCDYFAIDRILEDDPNKDIDFIISCVMDVEGDVQIQPGVVIQFEDGAGLYVRGNGSLNSSGTILDPITLTAKNKVKGAWLGILFDSPSTENKLNYTTIEYAGGGDFNSNGDLGSIILWANSKFSADNLSILNSEFYGLNATYTDISFTIVNSQIINGDKAPVILSPQYMSILGTSNDLTNNSENFVHVDLKNVDIEGDHTINNPSVPFRVFAYNSFNQNIRIISGTTHFENTLVVEFEDGTGIYVDDAGTIKTSSELEQIWFKGVNETAGAWNGIFFQFTQGDNELFNLVISHAGASYDGANGAIQMWGDPKISLTDVDFFDIDGCAVVDRPKYGNDPVNPNMILGSLIFYNNVSGGNYCQQGS